MNGIPVVMERQEVELEGGAVLRVARVRLPSGEDGVIVERSMAGDGPMRLLAPPDERLTLTEDGAAELRELLAELEGQA